MARIWPNGKSQPVDVWHEFGPREPIWTPAGYTSSFHWGIDLGPDGGTRMVSPVDGVITLSRWDDVFGNWVHVTESGTGAELWLCHLSSRAVSVGQHVRAGDYIGPMGETGKANGRHLHYEYHPGGQDRGVDPRAFYRSEAAAGGSGSPVPTESEEDDMYIANVKNGNFYLVIGTKAHALGKGSGARESGIPVINYPDQWAVDKLKTVVSGIA